MIAYLRGTVLEKQPNQVIVDAGGVGYDVVIPVSTFSSLPEVGAEVTVSAPLTMARPVPVMSEISSPARLRVFILTAPVEVAEATVRLVTARVVKSRVVVELSMLFQELVQPEP